VVKMRVMESWQSIAGWMKKVHADDLFKASGEVAGDSLTKVEAAWRKFGLIPTDFLKKSNGKTDPADFRSKAAFCMYHWDAGRMAGISLGNVLCGQYNAGFTLLRSYLELLVRGTLFQCLAQRKFRECQSRVLRPTDAVSVLAGNLATLVRERQIDEIELESDSMLIFDAIQGHWIQDVFRLELGSIMRQIADWGMLEGLEGKPEEIAGELYGRLSENAHERVERTDSGRAIEEGTDIFEWPAPILRKSLLEFLDDFHLAMEIGVVAVLNQLSDRVPRDRLRDNSKRLLGDEVFKSAHLKYSTKLLKGWASEFPI
jgi:hypothetical protein